MHYAVMVDTRKKNASRVHYYIDRDYGNDRGSAVARAQELHRDGKLAWVEVFYGDIKPLNAVRFMLIEKPVEQEILG